MTTKLVFGGLGFGAALITGLVAAAIVLDRAGDIVIEVFKTSD